MVAYVTTSLFYGCKEYEREILQIWLIVGCKIVAWAINTMEYLIIIGLTKGRATMEGKKWPQCENLGG